MFKVLLNSLIGLELTLFLLVSFLLHLLTQLLSLICHFSFAYRSFGSPFAFSIFAGRAEYSNLELSWSIIKRCICKSQLSRFYTHTKQQFLLYKIFLNPPGQLRGKYWMEWNLAAKEGHLLSWLYRFPFSYLRVSPVSSVYLHFQVCVVILTRGRIVLLKGPRMK